MPCSEQSAGIVLLPALAMGIGYLTQGWLTAHLAQQMTVADPYCYQRPIPTGRDEAGRQTFEYERICYEHER